MNKEDQVVFKCKSLFGKPDYVVSAPGRANIIGEHVDYCEGYVLPFSIEQSMYFAAVKAQSNKSKIYALDFDELFELDEDVLALSGWQKYFVSLRDRLLALGIVLDGLNIVFGSDIPIGGGVSSSSALCCGILSLFNEDNSLGLSKKDIIEIASGVEHGVGLKGGKMDQTAIVYGKKDAAILLDCQSETHQYIDLDLKNNYFILFDTNVEHLLVESEYNIRRSEVEQAMLQLKQEYGKELNFRNITTTQIEFLEKRDPIGFKRLRHVKFETERVLDSVLAIKDKNFDVLGKMLSLSHVSLMDDYNVSCAQLDFIVDKLNQYDQVLGSRMMGGGFGGNVIALVNAPLTGKQWAALSNSYIEKFNLRPKRMSIKPSKGLVFL